jgi:transcriptional regulator with XRE-family HTH domain
MQIVLSDATNQIDAKIGERLMLGLALKKLTAAHLASALRRDISEIEAYCIGSAHIDALTLLEISQIVDLPVRWFFTFDFKSLDPPGKTPH